MANETTANTATANATTSAATTDCEALKRALSACERSVAGRCEKAAKACDKHREAYRKCAAASSTSVALVLAFCCSGTLAFQLPTVQSTVSSSRVSAIANCASTAADDLDEKKSKAARLAELARQAELEAESAELEVMAMRQAESDRNGDALQSETDESEALEDEVDADYEPMILRAPLRWVGGVYPSIALSFPGLSTPAQKARQLGGDVAASGVTLDFVVDTAANTNTINAQVAGPTSQGGLELTQVGSISGGVGAGGAIGGGATYSLGTAELADVPKEERVPFISGLVATALPIAAPAAAGLLGTSFLTSFPGGVEFIWGSQPSSAGPAGLGEASTPPTGAEAASSLLFYGDARGTEASRAELSAVDVKVLPDSGLPTVLLKVNGVEIPALLDTGSPITVLNGAAAALAGVDVGNGGSPQPPAGGGGLFGAVAKGLQTAQAAARGDVLTVGGADGPVQLVRMPEEISLSLGETATFGNARPYVGDLPGLAALGGLGAAAGPAAVLGTDVLRRRPRLVFTAERIFL